MKTFRWLLVVVLALLTACGGGGGDFGIILPDSAGGGGIDNGGAAGGITPLGVSGVVKSGSLVGATVFADCNDNELLDVDEVSTQTSAGGQFTLEGNNLDQCPLVAVITADTVDEDTGQPVGKDYSLRAPAGSTAISPYTELVRVYMEQGQLTRSAAVGAVIEALGLAPNTDILGDFFALDNGNFYVIGQKLAAIYAAALEEAKAILYSAGYDLPDSSFPAVQAETLRRLQLDKSSLAQITNNSAQGQETPEQVAADFVNNYFSDKDFSVFASEFLQNFSFIPFTLQRFDQMVWLQERVETNTVPKYAIYVFSSDGRLETYTSWWRVDGYDSAETWEIDVDGTLLRHWGWNPNHNMSYHLGHYNLLEEDESGYWLNYYIQQMVDPKYPILGYLTKPEEVGVLHVNKSAPF
ncbi:MAG: hypothetical protein D6706_01910, partial [Chloroflexi bacterium]